VWNFGERVKINSYFADDFLMPTILIGAKMGKCAGLPLVKVWIFAAFLSRTHVHLNCGGAVSHCLIHIIKTNTIRKSDSATFLFSSSMWESNDLLRISTRTHAHAHRVSRLINHSIETHAHTPARFGSTSIQFVIVAWGEHNAGRQVVEISLYIYEHPDPEQLQQSVGVCEVFTNTRR